MNEIDKFLIKYSYKFEKGYPDLNNKKDILLLESILTELGIDIKLNEVNLSPTQLIKPFHSNSEFFGQYKDRGERFLENIEKGNPLQLVNGESIIIDKEKSKDAIELLKNKKYTELGGVKKLFFDKNGKGYSLSNFLKSKEYGAGSGNGGGSAQTDVQESTQCLVNALAYKLIKGEISDKDITEENLSKVKQYVFVTTPFEEMVSFALSSESWQDTLISTANILHSTYKNNNFTFHRNSEFVKKIGKAFDTAKKEKGLSLQINKWNPSDIWLVDNSIKEIEFKTTLEELNAQITDLYTQGKLIGVSLKKTGKEASLQLFNNEESKKEFTYETYSSSDKSKMSTLLFNDGKIYLRSFNYADNFAGEIAGKNALAGKIGIGIINNFISNNKISPIPTTKEVRKRIYDKDPKFEEDLYELYSQYVDSISPIKFKEYYEKQNEDWKFSKYLSLCIVNIFETVDNEIANNLMNDMVSYAKSSSSISSTFVKVS